MNWNRAMQWGAAALVGLVLPGCASKRMSEPRRTATEQLLLSTAADRALAAGSFSFVSGQRVYVETMYFEATDEEYVLGAIRDTLSAAGALLVRHMEDAEVIVEARSGALSTDSSESLTGLPSLPLPIPFAGVAETPEMAVYKSQKQDATAKIAMLAYAADSRQHVYSTGPLVGTSFNNYYQVLGFIKFRRTDIPEKRGLGWGASRKQPAK